VTQLGTPVHDFTLVDYGILVLRTSTAIMVAITLEVPMQYSI
jgi:16S rRNA U1498 N3-methylase RsmE